MKYQFQKALSKHFPPITGSQAAAYFDGFSSMFANTPKLDVLAFDDWLHEQHGEYEEKGQSMRDCIAAHYGEAAALWVESVL
jgi:hypothetical protein